MDTIYFGFDEDGELVETNEDGYTEGMDTVVLRPGSKSTRR